MKEGWTYKKLGDVCNVLNGLWIGKKEPFVNVAVIRNTNFSKDCKLKLDDVAYIDVEKRQFATRKLQVGDIIIEKSGGSDKQPVGRPVLFNIPDGDYSFSNFTSALRIIDKNILPLFLHYCLYGYYRNGETKRMQSKTTGLRNLDMKAYLRLAIPYFEIAEQERIVAELDLLSDIIEKKKEQLKAYDQLAQSIFYTMFGDPIDNPKGWETKKLDELCTVITKGTTPTTLGFPFVEEGINFVKVESFINGRIDSSKLSHITHECNLALSRSKLEDKDLLVCIAGATIGKMAVVDSSILPANTNQACAIIRLKDKRTIRYIQSFLELKFENDVMQMGKGVAQPNLSLGQLRNLFLPMPPIGQRETFTTTLEAIERQKALVQQSIEETQTMFDYTMDKYFG